MLLDCQLVPQTIVRPNSFVGLMALYESNYLRLRNLIPDLQRLDGCFRSHVAGNCSLHADVLERSRYTVTLSLTYYFDDGEERIAEPDMTVRAYLDGQLAEALSLAGQSRHVALSRIVSQPGEQIDARWRRNIVLNKWLEYLLAQGHLVLDRA